MCFFFFSNDKKKNRSERKCDRIRNGRNIMAKKVNKYDANVFVFDKLLQCNVVIAQLQTKKKAKKNKNYKTYAKSILSIFYDCYEEE